MIWIVTSALAYSMFPIFTKWALDEIGPTDALFWRFVIAAPLTWAMVGIRRAARDGAGPRGAPVPAFFGAGAVFGVLALLAISALDHLSAALFTVIVYTYPALVAAFSALLGKRPPNRIWIAIGVTAVGIALTVPEVFRRPDADVAGLVLTLGDALLYAGYIVATGRFMGDGGVPADDSAPRPAPDGLVASAWSFTGSLAFALAIRPFVGLDVPQRLGTWVGLIGLGVVSTVIAGTTFFFGLRRLGAPTAALIATLEPALTVVWAVTILGESLAALQVVGAVLVIGGVVWSQRQSPVAAAEPG